MTTDRVRKRIQTNSDNVADGLTRLQENVLELFNSRLDKYRDDMLKRDDEHVAMLKAFIDELGAVRAGLTGVSQSSSEILSAQKETHSGIAALSGQFQGLAESVNQLEHRMDASESDRAQLNERLARIEAILAARPVQREAEHADLLAAIMKAHGDAG